MYQSKLYVCVDVSDTLLKQRITSALREYNNKDMQVITLVNIQAIIENMYVLLITDNELNVVKVANTVATKPYIILNSINNDISADVFTVGYLRNDSNIKEVRITIQTALDFISTSANYWMYHYLLETLLDMSPNMIWFKDAIGRHTLVNKEFSKIVGKSVEECINKEHPDIWGISWEEYNSSDFACRKSENEIIENRKMGVFEESVKVGDNTKQLITYKSPLFDVFGGLIGTCGIGKDYTDFTNISLELDILISSLPFPIFICDENYNIVSMNNSAESLTGFNEDSNINYNDWKSMTLQHIEDNSSTIIYRVKNSVIEVMLEVLEQPIKDYSENISGYFCMLRDVTHSRLYEKMLRESAIIDSLTGLYTRRYFNEVLAKFLNKEVTVLYIDVDHFKDVNDTYGHSKGDDVLRIVSSNISDVCRKYTSFRIGGDEFAVIANGRIDDNEIQVIGNLINEHVTEDLARDGEINIPIKVSIGSNYVYELTDIESFIDEADKAMYDVKVQHHNNNV